MNMLFDYLSIFQTPNPSVSPTPAPVDNEKAKPIPVNLDERQKAKIKADAMANLKNFFEAQAKGELDPVAKKLLNNEVAFGADGIRIKGSKERIPYNSEEAKQYLAVVPVLADILVVTGHLDNRMDAKNLDISKLSSALASFAKETSKEVNSKGEGQPPIEFKDETTYGSQLFFYGTRRALAVMQKDEAGANKIEAQPAATVSTKLAAEYVCSWDRNSKSYGQVIDEPGAAPAGSGAAAVNLTAQKADEMILANPEQAKEEIKKGNMQVVRAFLARWSSYYGKSRPPEGIENFNFNEFTDKETKDQSNMAWQVRTWFVSNYFISKPDMSDNDRTNLVRQQRLDNKDDLLQALAASIDQEKKNDQGRAVRKFFTPAEVRTAITQANSDLVPENFSAVHTYLSAWATAYGRTPPPVIPQAEIEQGKAFENPALRGWLDGTYFASGGNLDRKNHFKAAENSANLCNAIRDGAVWEIENLPNMGAWGRRSEKKSKSAAA